MTRIARSIYIFGIYLLVVGVGFAGTPNAVLPLLGFPATEEVWVRVIGLLAIVLAIYYFTAARGALSTFFQATVPARPLVFAGAILLVMTGLGPAPLVVFGVVDLLGAGWTWLGLRQEKAAAAAT